MQNNLRIVRIRRGVSQEKLSELIGVSVRGIRKIENHEVFGQLQTWIMISTVLHITLDELTRPLEG